MIVDIKIKNFRSFLKENTFSMEATDTLSKENNVMYVDNIGRILKTAVIFGPNAAGKSNFVAFVYIFRAFVLGRGRVQNINPINLYNPFELRSKNEEPSSFSMKFVVEGMLYRYYIEALGKRVVKEYLALCIDDREEKLISRGEDERNNTKILYGEKYASLEQGVSNTKPDQSILTPFLYFDAGDLSKVVSYIAHIQFDDLLYFPSGQLDNRIPMLRHWMEIKKERKEKLLEYFNLAGINIKDITFRLENISHKLNVYFTHYVYNENHEVIGTKKFPYEAESNGTIQLLFYAMRAITAFETGSPVFVDEFNEGLHTQVSQSLMELFRSQDTNPLGAQLIATTHDIYLMDENNLRRDQIWFVDKDEEGVSEMYSLVEFKDTDEATPFAKWYLANRFGASPKSNRKIR